VQPKQRPPEKERAEKGKDKKNVATTKEGSAARAGKEKGRYEGVAYGLNYINRGESRHKKKPAEAGGKKKRGL